MITSKEIVEKLIQDWKIVKPLYENETNELLIVVKRERERKNKK